MTLSVNDGGNTGSGGAKSGSDTATINITAVNDALVDTPELVNADPYGEGWLIEMTVGVEIGGLLDADAYRALTE